MKARGFFAQKRGVFLLTALCMYGLGLAQTFQVTGKTGDSLLSLDETHFVTYTVLLTNSSTLTNVVPKLVPPACGEVVVGTEVVNIFDTSFVGYKSGVSWISEPIPSWANNTQKEISFYIHLYDNPLDHSICTDLCLDGVRFGLEFTSNSLSNPVPSAESSYLDMTRPISDVMGLTDRAAKFLTPLGLVDIFTMFDWALTTFQLTENPLDPDVRIFLLLDWNANTQNLTGVFELFYYPLASNAGLNIHNSFLNSTITQFDGILYDETGTLPSGPEGLITQAPLGGAGNSQAPLGTGMNFFDITDEPAAGGGTVRTRLGYSVGVNYYATIDQSGLTVLVLREAAIYLARPRECTAANFVFGPPQTEFRFESLHIDSNGNISAEINAPSEWMSAGDLSSQYSIEWFLRSKNTFSELTDVNLDGTKITLDTSVVGWLFGENFLEARVKHISSGSYVSVSSPVHGFYYSRRDPSFTNGEFPVPDEYLDPGETMHVNINMSNQSGELATGIALEVGYELGVGIDLDTGTYVSTTTLASGANVEGVFDFELLQVPSGCQEVVLFSKMSHSRDDGTFVTSYTDYYPVTTNCQDVPITFSSLWDWNPQNPEWVFEPEATRWSCQAVDGATTYILESPAIHPDAIVGSDIQFTINHTFAFDLNQAGGVLEYATSPDGVNWSTWKDLILEIEAEEGIQLYHPLPFPDTTPSSIANRRVFMSLDPPEQQSFEALGVQPNGLPLKKGEKVRFRALFQAPYLDLDRGLVQTWDIDHFEMVSIQPRPDTLFDIPRYQNFISCLPVSLPVGQQGTYSLKWYGDQSPSQDALYCLYNNTPYDVVPTFSGPTAEWVDYPTPNEDSTTYFLEIEHFATSEIRIIPFTINVPQGNVPPRSYMMPFWFLDDLESDLNEDTFVNILDFIIRENEDVCN